MKIPTNTLLNVDCVEGMRDLPDECIPFTLTSPPYDKMRDFGGHPFEFEMIADELFRITTKGGVVVWVVQDQIIRGSESGTSSRQQLYFTKLGFRLHNKLVMAKAGSRTQHKVRYGSSLEFAFVLSKGKPRTINLLRDKKNTTAGCRVRRNYRKPDGTKFSSTDPTKRIAEFGIRGNVWLYSGHTSDGFVSDHSAVMHEDMARDHVLSWSRPGDVVFDPMMGSATSLKMALLNDRRYLGMEIHEPYYEIAQKRMKLAQIENFQRSEKFVSTVPEIRKKSA